MIKFKINTRELEKSMGKKLREIKTRDLVHIHETITEAVWSKSNEYAPKDTGKMVQLSHINYTGDLKSEIVYPSTYAVNVEYGTPDMINAHGTHDPDNPVTDWKAKRERGATDPQMMPFLRPAVAWVESNFKKIVGEAVRTLPGRK